MEVLELRARFRGLKPRSSDTGDALARFCQQHGGPNLPATALDEGADTQDGGSQD